MALPILKKFIGNDQVDGSKILLENAQFFRAKKADGSVLEVFQINENNKLVIFEAPLVSVLGEEASSVQVKSQVEAAIAVETSARELGDSGLQTQVNALVAQDTTLQGNIDAEASARELGDSGLQTQVNALVAQDTTLQGNIDAETSARELGDSGLQTQVNALVAQDTTLQSNIDANTSALDAEVTRATDEEARIEGLVTQEVSDRIAADAALQTSINAASSALAWRQSVFLISEDMELQNAVEGDLVSAILPFSDDDMPQLGLADIHAGHFLLAKNGINSKLMKVIDDAGSLKVTFVGIEALNAGDTFVAKFDLIDSPSTQENRAIYHFDGDDMVKIGDFDWGLASGIDLSAEYVSVAGVVVVGDSVEVAIGKVVANLAAEKARAEAAELDLEGRIANESSRAIAEESRIESLLVTETSNREAGDANLQSSIDNVNAALAGETATRTSEDANLQSQIDSLSTSASTETSERTAADANLQSQIDAEALARTNGDSDLQSQMDAEVLARTNADTSLQSNIDAEALARTTADSDLQSQMDAEVSARSSADTTLQSNIDAEATARTAADEDLQNQLDQEILLRVNEDAYLTVKIETEVSDRIAGDAATLASAQSYADTKIANLINSAPEAFDTLKEIADYIAEDQTAGAALTQAIATEKTDREAADADLQAQITAEVSARTSADTLLQSNIDSEATARTTADSGLSDRITALENDGADAAALQSEIDRATAEEARIEAKLDAEITRSTDADTAIEARVTTLENAAPRSHKMSVTLVGGETSVTLDHNASIKSIVAAVGRLMIHDTEDYTTSVVNDKTVITFVNSIAVGGSEALSAGDKLFFTYQY